MKLEDKIESSIEKYKKAYRESEKIKERIEKEATIHIAPAIKKIKSNLPKGISIRNYSVYASGYGDRIKLNVLYSIKTKSSGKDAEAMKIIDDGMKKLKNIRYYLNFY